MKKAYVKPRLKSLGSLKVVSQASSGLGCIPGVDC